MLLLLHSRVNMLPALVGLMRDFTVNGLRPDIKTEELNSPLYIYHKGIKEHSNVLIVIHKMISL